MSTLSEIERVTALYARRVREHEAAAAAKIAAANTEAAASEAVSAARGELDATVRQYVSNVEAGRLPQRLPP